MTTYHTHIITLTNGSNLKQSQSSFESENDHDAVEVVREMYNKLNGTCISFALYKVADGRIINLDIA